MLLQVLYIISETLTGNRDKQKNYATPTNLIVLLYNYSSLPPNLINTISQIYLRWSGMNCKFSLSSKGVQEQEFHPVWAKRLLIREHRSLLWRRKEATTSSVFHKKKARQLNDFWDPWMWNSFSSDLRVSMNTQYFTVQYVLWLKVSF